MVEINSQNAVDKAREVAGRNQPVMRLYTPGGAEVWVPLSVTADYAALLSMAEQAAQRAMAVGWRTTSQAELAQGEKVEAVGWVVRMTKESKSGLAQVIHIYAAKAHFTKPILVVYLDTPQQIREFEIMSGLKVTDLPEYIGEGRIERGKNPRTDQLIIPVKKPFAVVYGPNPKYSAEEAEKATQTNPYLVPKNKFIRWSEVPPPPPEEPDEPLVERPVFPSDSPLDASPDDVDAMVARLIWGYGAARNDTEYAACQTRRRELWNKPGCLSDEQKRVLKKASEDAAARLVRESQKSPR